MIRVWHARWIGRGSAALQWTASRPLRTFTLIGIVLTVAYLAGVLAFPARHDRLINGDAIQYYAYVRSVVFDGDVDFSNDYRLLYADAGKDTNALLTSRTPAGRPHNSMSIGPAVLWTPFYLAALLMMRVAGSGPLNGMEPLLQASVGVAGIFYATLGSCLTFWVCTRFLPRAAAFWSTSVVWLAGPALYYSVVSPTYSHATSSFAVALFMYAWLRTRETPGFGRACLLGLLGGLVALVRWQDAIVLLVPLAELVYEMRRGRWVGGAPFVHLVVMGIAMSVTFAPQLLAWQAIFGTPMLMPQGNGFMQWSNPALWSVLFSLKHGLFTWTPALFLAVIGLPLLLRRDPLVGWSAVLVMAVAIYVNASVWDWWAGEAFGSRRFISYGVFLALGLGSLLTWPPVARWPRAVGWASVALVTYNALFLLQYQLFMRGMTDLVPYPTTAQQVFVDRLVLPFQLFWRWM